MLSLAPHLTVLDFDAGLRSKLEQTSPSEVGRLLDVRYIVSGSLARRADRLVLRIGLVNVTTNEHILSWRLESWSAEGSACRPVNTNASSVNDANAASLIEKTPKDGAMTASVCISKCDSEVLTDYKRPS